MLHPVTLILALLFYSTNRRESNAQITYKIEATWMDDPEEFNPLPLNRVDDQRWFKTFKENAENLGLTFAGKAEFPWIVDIRIETKPQQYWATGNLITPDTVFTTCRAIVTLEDAFETAGTETPRVTFGEMYLFEYALQRSENQRWLYGGTRTVKEFKTHTKCKIRSLFYDGGLIILSNGIMPAPPSIDTIQLAINYRPSRINGRLAVFDLSSMKSQRRVCYVASFGRDFTNINNTMVKDFKVKYRVYYESPEVCTDRYKVMCPNLYLSTDDCKTVHAKVYQAGYELMCFLSRAKVGTVCDHDKGAPLVCDGQVFGLVVLGANQMHCNDLIPVPFWVQKISMFKDYFDPTSEQRNSSPNRRRERILDYHKKPGSSSTTSSCSPAFSVVLIVFIYYQNSS